jgi:hypothetical protein
MSKVKKIPKAKIEEGITISLPYYVNWEGTWENGSIIETNYVFAQ